MTPVSDNELCDSSAAAMARLLRERAISARELMAAHLVRIALVNPAVNAIVAKLPDEECLARADEADRQVARSGPIGPLHGLPIAFKDLEAAAGFPCTRGSRIFRNTIPTADSIIVGRLRRAGAIPIGKTNVPELGMGSHTYNDVYGTTRNPYDVTKSAGGSSGGAGAALAAGMLPIADGSDLGGSLRNPANFNSVVALRPSVGRVPKAAAVCPELPDFAVTGPMARTVEDVVLLLGAMTDTRLALPVRVPGGLRIAWCPDLDGLPLDRRVREVVDAQRLVFESLGCRIEDACPDLSDADDVFLTIRARRSWTEYAPLLDDHRALMKPEAIQEIEAGARLTAADLERAVLRHRMLIDRLERFQASFEFLVCAVNQVPPFDASLTWPASVDGVPMRHYIEWMKSTYWISVTGCPAVSVPAGFTPDGLPVGIQIVGRARDDLGVLHLAHAFEQATLVGQRRPAVSRYRIGP